MAAGVLTLSTGVNVDVLSSSCFHAIASLHLIRPANQINAYCSTDPVVSGSTVTFEFSDIPSAVDYVVATTSASSFQAADLGSRSSDWAASPFLLQAILVVAAVFILFQGFRAGDKT